MLRIPLILILADPAVHSRRYVDRSSVGLSPGQQARRVGGAPRPLHRVAPEAHAGAPPAPARAALPGRAMPTPEWPMWHEGFIEQVEGESTKRVWVSVGLNSTLCVGPEKGAEPLSGKVYTIPPAGYKLACHARTRASAPVCG
jgi:hypothetical protein